MTQRYIRKVIRIRAEDSPNVRLALAQIASGMQPTNEIVIPGVLSWLEYRKRRQIWDKIQQCVCLDANFYEGAEIKLFPNEWLQRAQSIADVLPRYTHPRDVPRALLAGRVLRSGNLWMGVDPGEGGDDTAWCVGDQLGILKLESYKTPDTDVIPSTTLALMREFAIPAEHVGFDRGGGGKQHADRLRAQGYNVKTIGFGEKVAIDPTRQIVTEEEEFDVLEMKYEYKSRRVQLFGEASKLLDPTPLLQEDGSFKAPPGYGIPNEFGELIRQLSLIPKLFDSEGRMDIPPKQKRDAKDLRITLKDILGRSPDQADAFVVMVSMMSTPAEEQPFVVASRIGKKPQPS